ncbi:hypothetical protein SAMN06265374_2252 [Roseibium denhamense]|uniref:Uncharacterized protein n=1 Tax=Roseibium denhamense TaxID=76305 RepID=A0ABY1P1L7_9HYPH|nr:hypothetical protein SAMN06265374_2252 [Roseibium denhamense]
MEESEAKRTDATIPGGCVGQRLIPMVETTNSLPNLI